MNNNDIIRRIRYTFNFSDAKMIELFGMAGYEVTRAQVSDWLKKEEDPECQELDDEHLAAFLNGLIIDRRGRKEGPQPETEKQLNNNIILRKLKIALNLKDEDIVGILELVRFRMGKAELSAFFRNPGHKHYRECKDQVMRNFLHGMQLKYSEGQS
ncbi:DUF1456 family protein [Pontibacter saemangeumensis]|uniref:DUF1456 family protein n=1 Tax=Pontibacter saemangeumensis TaxID=1084525 RepID=A0ABP8M1K0_9BACT